LLHAVKLPLRPDGSVAARRYSFEDYVIIKEEVCHCGCHDLIDR